MKSCYKCLHSKPMTPLFGDMSCNLVCQIHHGNKKWIIKNSLIRALLCKDFLNRDKNVL